VLGLSAIDATMTPDSVVLLGESILAHRTSNLHCATPSRSVAINVWMKHRSTKEAVRWSREAECTSKNAAPRGLRHMIATNIRLVDLRFPPEVLSGVGSFTSMMPS